MAYLVITDPQGEISHIGIFKRLTSIGKGAHVDINLKNLVHDAVVAYINQSLNKFTLVVPTGHPEIAVNKIKTTKHDLLDNNIIEIGNYVLQFFSGDMTRANPLSDKAVSGHHQDASAVVAYRRMLDFSKRLAEEKDIEQLLGRLLREIRELTHAEHGFLVLLEDGKSMVKVKEPNDNNDGTALINPMSDSIVKKVIDKKEALIINDALHDQEFSSSLSVINYRLTSVMCAPLIYQGHTFGAIYVGNNSLTNVFDNDSLELMTIYSSQAAVLVQNALHINALKRRTDKLQESLELTKFGSLIGGCLGMQEVFRKVEKVASTDISVLITGEAGTGKELIARELHNRSYRKDGPFIVINCQSLPEDLLESELFGHVRGAFNGAIQSRFGKLQNAHNGTIYLDEISEMPLRLQVKLLQTLQDQSIVRMGDTKKEDIDVRVVAATTVDLAGNVKNNTFREDLYYRLATVQIMVPPLAERGNDVLVIANYFLQKYAKIYGKDVIGIEEHAQNALLNYDWPGNVRQLENRMRRAVVMCDHNRITLNDLDIKQDSSSQVIPLASALDKFRARYITESLERNAGNRTKTALELGVDPRTIFRHLEGKKKTKENDSGDSIG